MDDRFTVLLDLNSYLFFYFQLFYFRKTFYLIPDLRDG